MKDVFKGFYNPNDDVLQDVWSSQETIFIFDTNVLLNFYQYEKTTKTEFLELLENIKERVWIPHHVALEYQKNRLSVIKKERDVFDKIDRIFSTLISKLKSEVIKDCKVEEKLPELYGKIQTFIDNFNKLADEFKTIAIKPQRELKPEVRQHDDVRDVVDNVFESRIGEEFDQAMLDAIYAEGLIRFNAKIPPGFKDSSKDNDEFRYNNKTYKRMYGDLILWKQIIKNVKDQSLKKIIFVTGDTKEDWWYYIDEKMIGPLEELQTEFYRESEAEYFKMYTPADFLNDAKKYINAEISEQAILDVEKKNIENEENTKNNTNNIIYDNYLKNIEKKDILKLKEHPIFLKFIENDSTNKWWDILTENLIKNENKDFKNDVLKTFTQEDDSDAQDDESDQQYNDDEGKGK